MGAAAGFAPPASAADTPAAGSLEEIVVTATRREESISKVPISITALTRMTSIKRASRTSPRWCASRPA
jgi:iron complex outermembrane recepter protein